MIENPLINIGSTLSSRGFDLLNDTIKVTNNKGLEEIKVLLEELTELDFMQCLTISDYDNIQNTIWSNQDTIKKISENNKKNNNTNSTTHKTNTKYTEKGWFSSNFKHILAMAISVGCLVYLFCVTFFKGANSDTSIISQIVSGILNLLILIMAYYFGSSDGNNGRMSKNNEIKEMDTLDIDYSIDNAGKRKHSNNESNWDYFNDGQ